MGLNKKKKKDEAKGILHRVNVASGIEGGNHSVTGFGVSLFYAVGRRLLSSNSSHFI